MSIKTPSDKLFSAIEYCHACEAYIKSTIKKAGLEPAQDTDDNNPSHRSVIKNEYDIEQ